MRPWLLPAVYERLRAGRGEFLAELRPAIPVFVRFGGIDYDADDEAADKLDDFVRRAQRVLTSIRRQPPPADARRQGRVPLCGVRLAARPRRRRRTRASPPRSSCARSSSVTGVSDIQIGITTGRLWTGTYGHAMRRTFTCLGDAVNLAARLMSSGAAGWIVRDRGRARAGRRLVHVGAAPRPQGEGQGRAGRRLLARRRDCAWPRRQRRYELELVGRRAELQALRHGPRRPARGAGPRRRHRR